MVINYGDGITFGKQNDLVYYSDAHLIDAVMKYARASASLTKQTSH